MSAVWYFQELARRIGAERMQAWLDKLGHVCDIMVLEKTSEYTLRAKTGWAFPDQPEEVGWFVGWVERGDRTV